jgi:hypothetical protein
MADVLDLYAEDPDPRYPVVCFDESPTRLIGEVREPIPAASGRPERYDCEYRRNGTANLCNCPGPPTRCAGAGRGGGGATTQFASQGRKACYFALFLADRTGSSANPGGEIVLFEPVKISLRLY